MNEEQGWGRAADDSAGKVVGSTMRMALNMPHHDDVDELFAMYLDARVAERDHLLRHASIEQTRLMVTRGITSWQRHGSGAWVLRANGVDATLGELIGVGGCAVMGDRAWNLSFSLRPEHWGKG
jgi:RimJ/RimL family protein N-acetyltransferase